MRNALEVEKLSKSYGREFVVSEVSFSLRSGEVLGLLGPNGAGKTTIVGMLYGRVYPDSGRITYGQLEMPQDGREIRKQLGIVTQENDLERDFSVYENLVLFARYYRVPALEVESRVRGALERLGLSHVAEKTPEELSGGMQRRLTLARALVHSPKFIFLDEPTTGLDPDARQAFWRDVLELRASGCGILLTTHYMDEARRLCDRLILLQKGRSVDEGTPLEIIDRIVGKEVFEIEGVEVSIAQSFGERYCAWWRPFSDGYLLGVKTEHSEELWSELQKFPEIYPVRRPGNLEDVFLLLTGQGLDAVS